ncbi:MAG: hypothetical protein EOO09_05050 [Chitinophagaceae bacterium]|nr:MAG: hypothetical protein EOO09_05050 [Chitinophagaceae bacterium]
MKLSEFIGLSDDQKRATVLTQGIAVARRRLPDRLAFLYQFPDYYVETFYTERNPEFQEYRVFNDTRHLSPYLENISIEHLLK